MSINTSRANNKNVINNKKANNIQRNESLAKYQSSFQILLCQGATAGGIVVCEEIKMWKRVQEAVKKVSQAQPTLESVDTYHH
jgi:hypothetical protein